MMQDNAQAPETADARLKNMTLTALMTAVLCILCPLQIPVGAIPVTPGIFAICLAAYALGPVRGAASVLLYLLAGVIGVPVFAGYTAGPARLLGPTGGFLAGYVPLALIAGWFIRRSYKKQASPALRLTLQVTGMAAGLFVCYLLGTLWFLVFRRADGIPFVQALRVCVLPFLPLDALKIAAAAVTGHAVCRALRTTA